LAPIRHNSPARHRFLPHIYVSGTDLAEGIAMVLVVGATGLLGAEICTLLRAHDHAIRASFGRDLHVKRSSATCASRLRPAT
jgi:hypothetical protein